MEIFLGIGIVRECPENCCGLIVWNLCIKFCFGVYKPEMGMEIDSTKRNQRRKCGLPVDSPLAMFWDCKNSPGFV